MNTHSFETVDVLGIPIGIVSSEDVIQYISYIAESNGKAIVANANVHGMNFAHDLPWYRDFLRSADLVFCDGAGVILAARMLGQHIPERITYADWAWQLADYAERHELTCFFLGGKPGIADRAAEMLHQRHPRLQIVGTHHGYFDKDSDSDENLAIISHISGLRPDILLVGFGMPLQERWLAENWAQIDARVALTGGAVFDYVSGELRRGPKWMTDNGLEWLARLLIEPERLWRRYLIGNPLFLWRVLKNTVAARVR